MSFWSALLHVVLHRAWDNALERVFFECLTRLSQGNSSVCRGFFLRSLQRGKIGCKCLCAKTCCWMQRVSSVLKCGRAANHISLSQAFVLCGGRCARGLLGRAVSWCWETCLLERSAFSFRLCEVQPRLCSTTLFSCYYRVVVSSWEKWIGFWL